MSSAQRRKVAVGASIVALGAITSFSLTVAGIVPIPRVDVVWRGHADPAAYRPSGSIATGKTEEVVLVYIGSSSCGWSNVPELPGLVERMKRDLRAWSTDRELGFLAIGIARDINVAAGLRHIESFASFDEVMAGRSWANVGVQKYVYGELAGPGITPQVVIIHRRIEYHGTGKVAIESERVLARMAGLREITDWTVTGITGLATDLPG